MFRKELMSIVLLLVLCLVGVSAQAALVAEFNFDGGTLDTSGNGYTGAAGGLVGNTHYVAGAVNLEGDQLGQALDFDGDGDFIQLMVANDPGIWTPEILADQTAVSYAFWVKMDAYQSHDADMLAVRTWWEGDETNIGFHSAFGVPRDDVYLINNSATTLAEMPTGTITLDMLGQWVHVAATYDAVAGEAYVYINGVKGAKATINPTHLVDIGNYTLGGNMTDQGRYFDGAIDELKIYNHALSQAEVDALLVPEPATMTLLALGISSVLLRRRKSKQDGD